MGLLSGKVSPQVAHHPDSTRELGWKPSFQKQGRNLRAAAREGVRTSLLAKVQSRAWRLYSTLYNVTPAALRPAWAGLIY